MPWVVAENIVTVVLPPVLSITPVPSRKMKPPVGDPPTPSVTVAVYVTGTPKSAGFWLDVTVVVVASFWEKLAVTVTSEFIVTVHPPVPLHPPPDQPVKKPPALGVATRLTASPALKLALQVVPQSMPAGLEVTVPVPVPDFVTVSITAQAS
jgi:hypothetical protein